VNWILTAAIYDETLAAIAAAKLQQICIVDADYHVSTIFCLGAFFFQNIEHVQFVGLF